MFLIVGSYSRASSFRFRFDAMSVFLRSCFMKFFGMLNCVDFLYILYMFDFFVCNYFFVYVLWM